MHIIADDQKGPKWVINNLFGREEELQVLNNIAKEKKASVVLIEGGEGTGKTALIHQGDWQQNGWIFVSRKFEKKLMTEPYSALNEALDHLVKIWAENHKSVPSQMRRFVTVLQEDMDLLVNVIPGILRIVEKFLQDYSFFSSKIKSFADLTKSREEEKIGGDSGAIAMAFLKLFSFLSSDKPITILLDDVHYADASSLEILEVMAEVIATNPDRYSIHLLLAMSYRMDLLERNKFATRAIRGIEQNSENVHRFALKDFDVNTVNEMVASLLNSDPEKTRAMSKVIHKKTAGNPYAVSQFLRTSRENGYFKFSGMAFKWEWGDVEKLDQYASVSDNVAAVLASSMDKLPLPTKVALKVSSCLGKVISINTLVEHFKEPSLDGKDHITCEAIVGVQEEELESLLVGALKAGMLVKSTSDSAYMWSNDRLHEAAYDLIPVEVRLGLHKKLGMLLWRLGLEEDEEWMIFMAATQMNKYAELNSEASLGNEVAMLNLQAAKISLKKRAIYPAHNLLVNAERHMVVNGRWTDGRYDLTLNILTALAEIQLNVGDTERSMETAKLIVDNALTLDDKFRAHLVLLDGQLSRNHRSYDKGVELTLKLLQLYGEKHPKKFFPGQKLVEKAKLKKILPGGELAGLLELPDMTDKPALQIQVLLVEHLALYSNLTTNYKTLSWFACVRALKNVCKHGISPETPMAIIHMAMHMRREGHYKEASEYADFALLLLDRIPLKLGSHHGRVRVIASAGVLGAVRSFNKCLNEMLVGRAELLRAGLAKKSMEVVTSYATVYLCIGLPLGALETDLAGYLEDAKSYGCTYSVQQLMMIQRQTILNLQRNVNAPTVLSGDAMDQETELQKVEGHAHKMTKRDCDTYSLLLACIYGNWEAAERLIEALEEYIDADDAFLVRTHFRRCYLGLAGFALSRKAQTAKARKKYLSLGKKMLKLFITDMKSGSVNAFPIAAMLEAEEAPSKEAYDTAIKACARLGLLQHEAYTCEKAAEFFGGQDDAEWAEFYANQAILLYREWGANGKADCLEKDYSLVSTDSFQQQAVKITLQGRPRYSTKELDALRTIDWYSSMGGSVVWPEI